MGEKKPATEFEMTEDVSEEQITPERIKRVTVRIGGRDIPLKYDMRAQIALDDEIERDFDGVREELNKPKKVNAKIIITILRVLGNEGLRSEGQEADLTDEWIIDTMIPKDMLSYRVAALMAVMKGWYMETDNSDEQDIDVTLVEIRKKNGSTE